METSAVITTDRRVYHLRLISRKTDFTPYVGFLYPDDLKAQVAADLARILSIAPEKAALLVNNGYLSMDGLKTAGMKDISAIEGLDEASLKSISEALDKFIAESGKPE